MSPDEIIESFTARTGITILRASKEGVLRDYNVKTDFPEVLGAMLATVYGASVTAISDFSEGEEPVVMIQTDREDIAIVAFNNDIVAAFVGKGKDFNPEELKSLAYQLEESEY